MKTTTTLSLNLPPEVLEEAERLAKKEGQTTNELLRQALRRYITQRQFHELQRYGIKRAKDLGLKEGDVDRIIHEYRAEQQQKLKSQHN